MDIENFANRPPPRPWQGDYKIPWNEPGFSERMLREHLGQDHHAASRPLPIIHQQVEFLHERVLNRVSGKVLDLGCGPGLYCRAFAELGHQCTGIDFSPASIDYARQQDPSSTYRLEDVRKAETDNGFDLVMMLFGEFNAFPRDEARQLLEKMRDAAWPQGSVVLEVSTDRFVQAQGEKPRGWHTVRSGIFSAQPHLWLDEHFWLEDSLTAVSRHYVLTGDEQVQEYHDTLQAYRQHEYVELLQECGFRRIGQYPSLAEDPGLFLLVAK